MCRWPLKTANIVLFRSAVRIHLEYFISTYNRLPLGLVSPHMEVGDGLDSRCIYVHICRYIYTGIFYTSLVNKTHCKQAEIEAVEATHHTTMLYIDTL